MTSPYSALAPVYDRWTATNDYPRWAEFIRARLPDPAGRTVRILDVCCGTGTLARLLGSSGYLVTGVDASERMLAVARAGAPDGQFRRAALPHEPLGGTAEFDAATCTFDSLNYLVDAAELRQAFERVADALRTGGLFIFDINTERKLRTVFGDSHYGDDLGDFAYVWRNRTDVAARTTRFAITLFTQGETGFHRDTEVHVQRWFDRDELLDAAAAAGFTVDEIGDDYTNDPAGDDTMRETWVVRKTG